jgi:ParB/RepB/Spo0J family partition protein
MQTVNLKTESLKPNDYNPNAMTQDEFAELVAEVRHLGHLPKPVVVRPNCNGYVIVDGEHGWRAAREVGLSEVPCEVAEVDDFEAMRQTYKRNQHGTHHPVKLGQMFQAMMKERDLSQRALATEIGVSEGTIRNALEYAKAGDVRNSYARDVEKLTVRQVRYLNKLPSVLAVIWMLDGADVKDLLDAKTDAEVAEYEREYRIDEGFGRYNYLDVTGLLGFVNERMLGGGFKSAIKTLEDWDKMEHEWARGGISREQLRLYTSHCYRGAHVVRKAFLMESALCVLIDATSRPPSFRLTPDEFASVINDVPADGDSVMTFLPRLRLAVAKKTGKMPSDRATVSDELSRIELEAEAPDYIRESKLPLEEKYALWKANDEALASHIDNIKRGIARLDKLPRQRGEDLKHAARRLIRETFERWRMRSKMEHTSERDLAELIASRLPLYDKQKEVEAFNALVDKLATLTKPELVVIEKYTEDKEAWKRHVAMFKAMLGKTN